MDTCPPNWVYNPSGVGGALCPLCQDVYLPLVWGWSIAFYDQRVVENVVAEHEFGTGKIVFEDGSMYYTKSGFWPGTEGGSTTILEQGNEYQTSHCNAKILMVKRAITEPSGPTTKPTLPPTTQPSDVPTRTPTEAPIYVRGCQRHPRINKCFEDSSCSWVGSVQGGPGVCLPRPGYECYQYYEEDECYGRGPDGRPCIWKPLLGNNAFTGTCVQSDNTFAPTRVPTTAAPTPAQFIRPTAAPTEKGGGSGLVDIGIGIAVGGAIIVSTLVFVTFWCPAYATCIKCVCCPAKLKKTLTPHYTPGDRECGCICCPRRLIRRMPTMPSILELTHKSFKMSTKKLSGMPCSPREDTETRGGDGLALSCRQNTMLHVIPSKRNLNLDGDNNTKDDPGMTRETTCETKGGDMQWEPLSPADRLRCEPEEPVECLVSAEEKQFEAAMREVDFSACSDPEVLGESSSSYSGSGASSSEHPNHHRGHPRRASKRSKPQKLRSRPEKEVQNSNPLMQLYGNDCEETYTSAQLCSERVIEV